MTHSQATFVCLSFRIKECKTLILYPIVCAYVCVCVCEWKFFHFVCLLVYFLLHRTIKCNFISKQNTGNTMIKPFDSHCFKLRFPCSRCIMKWTKGFPRGSAVKNLPAKQELWETRVWSLGGEDPLRRVWQPTPALLPGIFWRFLGKSHGQRSLVGYSPQGCKESHTTEVT